jgi:hypothetical protein
MNPDDIQLDSMGKSFEYEKIAREIEKMDRDQAINCAKSYFKLYLKQQEVVSTIGNIK